MKPWPDPRDDEPERPKSALVYFIAALIGAIMLTNLTRGLLGYGWNW